MMHMQFCKSLLGVNRSTQNNICEADLGRFPLKTIIDRPDRQLISFMNCMKSSQKQFSISSIYLLDSNLDNYNLITENKQVEKMTATYSQGNT